MLESVVRAVGLRWSAEHQNIVYWGRHYAYNVQLWHFLEPHIM